jgi:hypothetical protein
MSQQLGLERMVAGWMADEATGIPEDLADQVFAITSATRPAPRWVAVLREPPMRVRSHVTRHSEAAARPYRALAPARFEFRGGAILTILRTQASIDEWPGFQEMRAGPALPCMARSATRPFAGRSAKVPAFRVL